MDMTWECLILLSLSKKRPKKNNFQTQGVLATGDLQTRQVAGKDLYTYTLVSSQSQADCNVNGHLAFDKSSFLLCKPPPLLVQSLAPLDQVFIRDLLSASQGLPYFD